MEDEQVQVRVAQVETRLNEVEALPAAARETAISALQGLLELYGEGLARILRLSDAAMSQAFADDELISHLLMLHGLHLSDVATRVQGALESVRPYLASHGGNVELLGIENGVVHLRLQGSCKGCPSSTMTLKTAIEEAILEAAPDVVRIEAEGVAEPPSTFDGLIPLTSLELHEKVAMAK